MNLTTHETAAGFLDAALDCLLREEAKNNLILGISLRVRDGHSYGAEAPLFLTVHDGETLAAAAVRTPPYNLILHGEPDRLEAVDAIVGYLLETGHTLPGVNGALDVASAFCRAWTRRTGQTFRLQMSQRIYALTHVRPLVDVSGHVRWACEDDVPTLARWFLGFSREAVPSDPPSDPEANVRRFMTSGRLAVWDIGEAVSMAGSSRGTPNGGTISAVYTPPEHRRRGYASACVAALSQALLDAGHRFCALYTDLANPTSNKIYQDVGYNPIADWGAYAFGDPDE